MSEHDEGVANARAITEAVPAWCFRNRVTATGGA